MKHQGSGSIETKTHFSLTRPSRNLPPNFPYGAPLLERGILTYMATHKITTRASDSALKRFLRIKLRKASVRIHRACQKCRGPRLVCPRCARMMCIDCDEVCQYCPFIQETGVKTTLTQATLGRRVDLPRQKLRKPRIKTVAQPDIDIPAYYRKWFLEVQKLGYITQSITANKDDSSQHFVEVYIPENVPHVRPDMTEGWFGHHIAAYGVMPKKKGLLVTATLEDHS